MKLTRLVSLPSAWSPCRDWIWPTVRMQPVENFYGAFPISGEIDVSIPPLSSFLFLTEADRLVSGRLSLADCDWPRELCVVPVPGAQLYLVHPPLGSLERLRPILLDLGLDRAEAIVLQRSVPHVRNRVDRQVPLDLSVPSSLTHPVPLLAEADLQSLDLSQTLTLG